MKRLLMLIPLVLLCCFTVGCEKSERVLVEPKAEVEADIKAIEDIIKEWEAAINSGDIDTIMSFYADDSVKIPPNEPSIVGKGAIRNGYEGLFEAYTHDEKHEVVALQVNGDMAFTNTTWSLIATPKAGGEPKKTNGNWVRIFGKQDDGTWKVTYMMFSDESLIYPNQPE